MVIQAISYAEAVKHALLVSQRAGKPYWVYMDPYCQWQYSREDPGMAPPYWVVYRGAIEFVSIGGRVSMEP